MSTEFDLIDRYFSQLQSISVGTDLGIGDDAALLRVPQNHQLVVSTDTLVSGVHFPQNLPAKFVATRALGTSLSDLAAMGAEARWFTLAITHPDGDEAWMASFSEGLCEMATACRCALVGGDTTRGPLTVSITVQGVVPVGQALTRSGAKVGDRVFVSGHPGLGAAGLAVRLQKLTGLNPADTELIREAFDYPRPQLDLGLSLRGLASAAIDISDGLVADLGHICQHSSVGAIIDCRKLPHLPGLLAQVGEAQCTEWALTGGDDYQLCFTVPENRVAEVSQIAGRLQLNVTEIGEIKAGHGVECLDIKGNSLPLKQKGYQHFQ